MTAPSGAAELARFAASLASGWLAGMGERAVAGLLALPVVALAWGIARRRGSSHLTSALLVVALAPLVLPVERVVPSRWIPRPLAAAFAPLRSGAARRVPDAPPPTPKSGEPSPPSTVAHGLVPLNAGSRTAPSVAPSAARDATVAAATTPRAAAGSTLAVALFVAWLVVVVALLGRLAADLRRTRAALRQARPLAHAELPLSPSTLACRAGLARLPPIVESDELPAPSTCGVVAPVVVLPPALRAALGDEGLRFVLLHELAHVRRRDPLVALFERLVRIVWFVHPTAWLAGSLLAREREHACDDAALASLPASARPQCAEALLRVIERSNRGAPARAAALALSSGGRAVKERLLRIVDPAAAVAARMSPRSRTAFVLCIAALLFVLAARVAPQAAPPAAPAAGATKIPDAPVDPVVVALQNGIEWLLRHQEGDGHFSAAAFDARCKDPGCAGKGEAGADVGVTALAAEAFLGAVDQEPAKSAAARALDWLVTQQDRTSGLIAPSGTPSSHRHYGHVYATLALVDGFATTATERWQGPAQKGLDYLRRAHNPYRGWRYGVADGDNDSSLTGLVVYVMAGARNAGFAADRTAIDGGVAFLDEMTDAATGRTGYQQKGGFASRTMEEMKRFPAENSESLTAIALNARIQVGQKIDAATPLAPGVALLVAQPPRWDVAKGTIDYNYWYHATRALFLLQGPAWKVWKPAIVHVLTTHQCGMETQTKSDGVGSFPPADAWSDEGGRVYATAINLITLEICSRDR